MTVLAVHGSLYRYAYHYESYARRKGWKIKTTFVLIPYISFHILSNATNIEQKNPSI